MLNARQMRDADQRTIALGTPARVLMERAGGAVAAIVARAFAPIAGKRVAVLCGRGNNGGDGFVAARALAAQGAVVGVFVVGDPSGIKGDARDAYDALEGVLVPIALADRRAWHTERDQVLDVDVIVDAITGTGFAPPLTGLAGEIAGDVNGAGRPVVAVDLPSGLSADTADVAGDAIEATMTVALAAPKLPHALPPAEAWTGTWQVADIGIPADVIDGVAAPHLEIADAASVRRLVRQRARDSHKGQYGRVLIVAGSRGKTGAAYLAAMGALRSGAGLVTIATPASCVPIVAALGAEYMSLPLDEDPDGRIAAGALDAIVSFDADVIAIGPGLGRSPALDGLLPALVARSRAPLVIDADGLNAFSDVSVLSGRAGRDVIVTPHPGEMARLTAQSIEVVQRDRLAAATTLATSRHLHVVLKGHRTIVAAPDGRVAVNHTGNPGMATAGTGDVLTGAVAAWLGQLRDAYHASMLAVYLHGRAGDLAAATVGEIALVAGDVLGHLAAASLELMSLDSPESQP